MFRNLRTLLALAALTGVSLTVALAWITGAAQTGIQRLTTAWQNVAAWLDSPSLGEVPGELGAIVLPLAVMLVLMAALSGQ